MFWKTRTFWVMVVGLLLYIVKQYFPNFPISEEMLLDVVVFVLGLFGVVLESRLRSQNLL